MHQTLKRGPRASFAIVATAALAVGACSEVGVVDPAPVIVDETPVNTEVSNASWVADVDLIGETVTITPPRAGGVSLSRVLSDYFGADPSAQFSLIGSDVVDVLPVAGTLDFAPANLASGRRRVSFDIQIQNKLSGTALQVPTEFPIAPAGVTSPVIFSFRNVVTTTTGDVSGSGSAIIVETPNEGTVVTSDSIWAGPPQNFFNEATCTGTGEVDASSDCFLYLPIVEDGTNSDTIPGLAASAPIRVGYDLELTVNSFRSNLIVAADLIDSTPNALPTAAFLTSGTPYNGVPLSLDASSSSDSDGFIVTYLWSDGGAGGSFSSTSSATPTYTAAGSGAQVINLSVTVTDNRGGQDTFSQGVSFTDAPSDITLAKSLLGALTDGGTATYQIQVSELLGGAAQSVVVTDVLPAGVANPTNISNGGSFAGGVITWNLGTIAGLSSTTLSFDVDVVGTVGATVDNTADVTSTTDTNAGNNSSTASATVQGQPNLLGRWVAVSGSLAAGTPLTDGSVVATGDVLELQICVAGFDPNAAEVETTWNTSEVDLQSGPAALFQSTDANAHPDCADTFDTLDEFFAAGPATQNINNKAALIDLTGGNSATPYTAGIARYTFTVTGTSGNINVTGGNAVVGDYISGSDVSGLIVIDYDFLTIN